MARRNGRIHPLLILLVLFGAAAVGWVIWKYQAQPPLSQKGGSGSQSSVSQDTMTLAIQAVAAAEDQHYDEALKLWRELLKTQPEHPSLQLNLAVTLLKWVDESRKVLSSGKIKEPAEIARVESELKQALDQADEVISVLQSAKELGSRGVLLQAMLLEAKSQQFQYPDDRPLIEQATQLLRQELKRTPAQPLLACKLEEVAQTEISADEKSELSREVAEALLASWKSDPRNLYLQSSTGFALLRVEDSRLADFLTQCVEIDRPLFNEMKLSLHQDPVEFAQKTIEAIRSGDWRKAQQLRRWINVLKGPAAFKPDNRLLKPDVMALLDTTFLNSFSDRVTKPTPASKPLPDYQIQKLADSTQTAIWYDYDLDLDFDVMAGNGNELLLFEYSSELKAEPHARLPLPFAPQGMLAVDLWSVDNPDRPRLPLPVSQIASSDVKPLTPNNQPGPENAKAPESSSNQHDTIQELVLWGADGIAVVSSKLVDGKRELFVLEQVPGLVASDVNFKSVSQVEPLDIDADGDLDLVVASDSGVKLLQNNGNRTFSEISEFSQLPADDFKVSQLYAVDVDRDLDQDILIASPNQAGIWLLENILHSQFRIRELKPTEWPVTSATSCIQVAELDGNASWDIVTTGENGTTLNLSRTTSPGSLVGLRQLKSDLTGRLAVMADLNNDSLLDLIVAGPSGLRTHAVTPNEVLVTKTLLQGNATALSATDANQDGKIELLTIVDGQTTVLQTTATTGKYLDARVRGISDDNGGGRINHFAVGSTLELWSNGTMQARVIREPITHFGLDQFAPTNLRITFNNGLTQNNETVQADVLVQERQELKGSCPFVYGWNGERFELITDLLWNAPLGLQIAPGKTLPDRRWEYLLLPAELMQPRSDGTYELRVTEELWEVAYFDQIELIAIDHPPELEVFTNEKVGPPSIAEHQLFTVSNRLKPRAAMDQRGRDCLERIVDRDRHFVQAFDIQYCQGLCEPHFIELDFGQLPTDQPLRLFLSGWLHPTDTSLNIGLSQNPDLDLPEPPSLWVVDESGDWVCAQPFMGFPGGKPKSIVIDLKDVFRSQDHRLRIASSQQVYWDEAFVSSDSNPRQLHQERLEMLSADLQYRGFGKLLPRSSDQPHWYDYHNVSTQAKWPKLNGPFTRYGDVLAQLRADDDRLLVMASGDECVLKFSAPTPVPAGWRRDFVLHSIGWDKDADLNTLAGDGSLPLPFKDMKSYPPPAEQNDEAAAVLKQNGLNRW